jgi:hypothetical protein
MEHVNVVAADNTHPFADDGGVAKRREARTVIVKVKFERALMGGDI